MDEFLQALRAVDKSRLSFPGTWRVSPHFTPEDECECPLLQLLQDASMKTKPFPERDEVCEAVAQQYGITVEKTVDLMERYDNLSSPLDYDAMVHVFEFHWKYFA